jgi:hypothetical protein
MRCDDGDEDDAARISNGVLFCSTRGSVDGRCKIVVKKKGRSGGRILHHDDGKLSSSEGR